MKTRRLVIGIDIGGTFTDVVVIDQLENRFLKVFKLPSTPANPEKAFMEAITRIQKDMCLDGGSDPLLDSIICHGTTVSTNALIERKGARVVLVATKGFTDVIELRRQNRPRLFDRHVRVSEPLVGRDMRVAVEERIEASGNPLHPIQNLEEVIRKVDHLKPEIVVVALLNAYANNKHEVELCRTLSKKFPNIKICISTDICNEHGEYERTSTAVVNAYIAPQTETYLSTLDKELMAKGVKAFYIVKSNGGLSTARNAMGSPVHLIESGPAAGITAAAKYAEEINKPDVIAFDMGGTTAKAGVITGFRPRIINEFYANRFVNGVDMGGYPIRSAVVDLVEIGAGGGSVAWIDEGGALKVGPESAGAFPGPACYSRGGTRATITDAHAVIGSLSEESFEGSGVLFSHEKAWDVIEREVARPMSWGVAKAAHAVVNIAIANMIEMIRLATVNRGLDPTKFSMIAFGGAGPLHASAVAKSSGLKEVIIPPFPGMFSGLGAVWSELRHDVSVSILTSLNSLTMPLLESSFKALSDKLEKLISNDQQSIESTRFECYADLRFQRQLFEIRVSAQDDDEMLLSPAQIDAKFRRAYEDEFGFDLPMAAVQLVSLHMTSVTARSSSQIPLGVSDVQNEPRQPLAYRSARILGPDNKVTNIPVYKSESLITTHNSNCNSICIEGPLLVDHWGSTVLIDQGQTLSTLPGGGIVFTI